MWNQRDEGVLLGSMDSRKEPCSLCPPRLWPLSFKFSRPAEIGYSINRTLGVLRSLGLSDKFEGRSDSEKPLWRTRAQEQSKRLTHCKLGIYMTQGRPSGNWELLLFWQLVLVKVMLINTYLPYVLAIPLQMIREHMSIYSYIQTRIFTGTLQES